MKRMTKFHQGYGISTTDSEETEENSDSVDNVKKKKKASILKYTAGSLWRKKCVTHTKPESHVPVYRSRSRCSSTQKMSRKLHGILKNSKFEEREYSEASEDDDSEPRMKPVELKGRYLVGKAKPGDMPGRAGGMAIVIRRACCSQPTEPAPNKCTKNDKTRNKLSRKRSY